MLALQVNNNGEKNATELKMKVNRRTVEPKWENPPGK